MSEQGINEKLRINAICLSDLFYPCGYKKRATLANHPIALNARSYKKYRTRLLNNQYKSYKTMNLKHTI